MFKKREYAIYFHSLFEEGEGTFIISVRGWNNARRLVKVYNSATLVYGWYYMKRIK